MALLDDAGKQRIEASIAQVEAHTAGEIVVITVTQSDRYDDVRLLCAGVFGLLVSVVTHLLAPELVFAWLIWLQVGSGVLAFLALGTPVLLRAVVPQARMASSALARAEREFLEHGIFATRARAGILIMLSECEHQVVILGDRGIHERVQTSGWQHHVEHIVRTIHTGRAADGVCEVIAELGEMLAATLPATTGDRNELDNAVKHS